jgi:hypothetical protein
MKNCYEKVDTLRLAVVPRLTKTPLVPQLEGRRKRHSDRHNTILRPAHGLRLQTGALHGETWHDDDSRWWGSTYDFTQKLMRFISYRSGLPRTGASCCTPLRPPTSQLTDRNDHFCAYRAMELISLCSWPRVKKSPIETIYIEF